MGRRDAIRKFTVIEVDRNLIQMINRTAREGSRSVVETTSRIFSLPLSPSRHPFSRRFYRLQEKKIRCIFPRGIQVST